jgi:2-dehydro-3-deoxyphosphooctonate aldolase (KDO 8-P synthase)
MSEGGGMMKQIDLQGITIGGGAPIVLIAGPCVIEDAQKTMEIAEYLKELSERLRISLIFKASYDKANRTSVRSYRGPGAAAGLTILNDIREKLSLPVLTDVHRFEEIRPASQVADILQVPAFLCRQTDFVIDVARQARIINIKKGQFIAPGEVSNIIEKIMTVRNENILITERGTFFGYNNLVVDYRALPAMRGMGYPVVFDATHSVQLPGGRGTASGGQREMVSYLARAAVAVGIDGLFMEVHPDPDAALCDGPNSIPLNNLDEMLRILIDLDALVKRTHGRVAET